MGWFSVSNRTDSRIFVHATIRDVDFLFLILCQTLANILICPRHCQYFPTYFPIHLLFQRPRLHLLCHPWRLQALLKRSHPSISPTRSGLLPHLLKLKDCWASISLAPSQPLNPHQPSNPSQPPETSPPQLSSARRRNQLTLILHDPQKFKN